MDWDEPPNIQRRQSAVFRKQATRLAQENQQRQEQIRRVKDAQSFRRDATKVVGRHTDARSFRADAKKLVTQQNQIGRAHV